MLQNKNEYFVANNFLYDVFGVQEVMQEVYDLNRHRTSFCLIRRFVILRITLMEI